MRQLSRLVLVVIFLIGIRAVAQQQTAVTNNNDGSSGTVPMYSGGAALTNSAITQANSNVGIGTTSPNNLLEINGGAFSFYNPGAWVAVGMDYDPSTDALRFRSNNTSPNINQTNVSIQRLTGYLGIGT